MLKLEDIRKDAAVTGIVPGQDRKWEELSKLLQSASMRDESGLHRKLILFTEYRDTLNYLAVKIRGQHSQRPRR